MNQAECITIEDCKNVENHDLSNDIQPFSVLQDQEEHVILSYEEKNQLSFYKQNDIKQERQFSDITRDIVADLREFDFILTISQQRDFQIGFEEEQKFLFIKQTNPSSFSVNITRQKNDEIQNNYIINSIDISRNHAKIICKNRYQFYLHNFGKNGTFIKIQNYQKIKQGMQLLLGNIIIEFQNVKIENNTLVFQIRAFNMISKEQTIETSEIMTLNSVLTISRQNSNFKSLDCLFSKDSQLSRMHGEIHFKEVLKENKKKLQFFYKDEILAPRNGSWVKIQDQQQIEDNTILKLGKQYFLKIQIEAIFKQQEEHNDLEWRKQTIDKQIKMKDNKIHPGLLPEKDISVCKRFTFDHHHHYPNNLFIAIECGHVFCSELKKESIEKFEKEVSNDMFKRVCPYCLIESSSYQITIENKFKF